MMDNLDRLAQKWQNCWRDRPVDRVKLDHTLQLLVTAYTQSDRYYHNLTHIHQLLTTLDRFSDLFQDPLAVSLAAWFHDFIYAPQDTDNEAQSAKLASKLLTDIGLSIATCDRVHTLIMATQGHQIEPHDPDLCIFLDADLAILGADPVGYQVYQRSIRREYSWVADEAYRVGRIRVLESFLQRDRLYATDLLFGELESIARLNIQQEIASYSSPL
ncbi:hypothetical protein [Chamaesiphon sp.]|uniref:HD domain-containing protein n=1 Tax=Chamaesiphon sp. TaxID=2814140 RepID=UPI00359457DA